MSEQFTNRATTTLNGAIDDNDTSLVVTSATGFPTTGTFRIVVSPGAGTEEIMTVTAVSGTTFTILRATEAIAGVQTARSHSNGATIKHVLTAGALKDLGLPTGFIGAKAIYSSGSLAGTGAYHAVPFNGTDEFDTDGFHDPSTNNSRITIPAGLSGPYLLIGHYYNNAANELAYSTFKKNGTAITPGEYSVSGDDTILHSTTMLILAAGDYVEFAVNANSSTSISAASFEIYKMDSGRVGKGVGAAIYNSSNGSVATGGESALAMDSELFDTDGFHDNSTNNQRFTIPVGLGGIYSITLNLHLSSSVGSQGYVIARKNGSQVILMSEFVFAGSHGTAGASTVIALDAGDYVEFKTLGDSAGTITGTSTWAPWATIMKLDSNSSGVLASARVIKTDGNFSTSNTTFTDVTGVSVTLTTGARKCRVSVVTAYTNTDTSHGGLDIAVDGTRIGAASTYGLVLTRAPAAGDWGAVSFSVDTDVLSAGSHTIKLQMRVGGSTGTLAANTSLSALTFSVQELPDSGVLAAGVAVPTTRLALDYDYAGSDISGQSVSAGTWTDIISNQNFTVANTGSILEFDVRSMIQTAETSGGDDFVGGRIVIDSAGTPINKQFAGDIAGDYNTGYFNPFKGSGTVKVTGLSAGTHTVKVQIYLGGGGNFYLRPSASGGFEFLGLQVTEISPSTVPPTGPTRILRGQITPAGAVASGTGFSAAKTATGKYTITPSVAFSSIPIVTVTLLYNNNEAGDGSTAIVCFLDTVSTTEIKVFFLDSSGSAFQDGRFNFIAMSVD